MTRHGIAEGNEQSRSSGQAAPTMTHPDRVVAAHARALSGSAVQSRYVEIAPEQRMHALEAGGGLPLVLLHGSGPTALQFLPLPDRLTGVHAIAVDRPGFGLSGPADPPPLDRDAAAATVTDILDALRLDATALVGSSTRGTWALWFALAHPDRVTKLVLLGAPPLMPGTQVPPPLLTVAISAAGPPPLCNHHPDRP